MVAYRPDGTEHGRDSQLLVRPPQDFLDAHGTGREDVQQISPAMLADQPDWASVRNEIGARLAGRTMLPQNSAYERRWLSHNLPNAFDADAPTIDPTKLSRLVNPKRKKHSLVAICECVDLPHVDSHRSTPDAAMAAQAYFRLRSEMHDRWIHPSPEGGRPPAESES